MSKIRRRNGFKVKKNVVKTLTRKEKRKQKQLEKKERKRFFFSKKKNEKKGLAGVEMKSRKLEKNGKSKIALAKKKVMPEEISIKQLLRGDVNPADDESINSDFSDAEVDALIPAKMKAHEPLSKKPRKQVGIQRLDEVELRKRELQKQKALEIKSRKQRLKQLKLENEEEDKVIAKLEKKLKLNKTKDKNRVVRKMFNDGLDYLLDFVLDDQEEAAKWEKKQRLKQEQKEELENEKANTWSDTETDGQADEATNNDVTNSNTTDHENNDVDRQDKKVEDLTEPEFKEDIYGRKRDKQGNIITDESLTAAGDQKYIPPHHRALMSGSEKQSELLVRLHKNCKGLLNRLSEQNLHKISMCIEELYMKNSRYHMNETLTVLLTEALIVRTIANERMVQVHMVLLAYLHAHIGSEIGAHFLQVFIEQFDGYIKDINQLEVADKRLNNLILVLCYMYIFKIYDHRLLLEIISKLMRNLCEKSIECLLLIFQSVGFKLRKDDPMGFKQMMHNIQQKIAESSFELKENLRLKFMIDILIAVKNNNMNKLPQYDPELAETLRKRLKGMLRNDRYVVTLNITLDDLLRADKLGKWWIVGSAWSGSINEMGSASVTTKETGTSTQRFSDNLLALAKKQKMNTAERRNIFCIIMSADDYVDAFEKLLHLCLKDQRSIAYVIIHCCLNEKNFNPYYSHLSLKFCQYNRKFQLAFQFATWDRINDIESLTKLQIRNLVQFLQHLILAGGLQLSVLKVVNFVQLDKLSFYFMKEVIVGLLLAKEESEVYHVFKRIAKNAKLQQFKQSVRLFMQHFLLQQDTVKLKLKEQQLTLLQQRIDYVDKLLAYADL